MRHEVQGEFKKMCIEVPEFAFDVLTNVLDYREKAKEHESESTTKGGERKRLRGAA